MLLSFLGRLCQSVASYEVLLEKRRTHAHAQGREPHVEDQLPTNNNLDSHPPVTDRCEFQVAVCWGLTMATPFEALSAIQCYNMLMRYMNPFRLLA